jgi:hypothetical protein
MEPLVHAVFLVGTAIIALIPVLMVSGLAQMIGWVLWIAIWGTLASLTTLDILVFDPQILRLAAHLGGQVSVGLLLFAIVPPVRRAVRGIPLEALVRWQIARVIGGFFLIGAVMGEVSVPFALIAGTGDVLVGLAAARTVRAMNNGDPLGLAHRHTQLGLLDFMIAISTAIVTGAKIGGPYILIPLLLVPMALLGHLAVLDRVRFQRARIGPGLST